MAKTVDEVADAMFKMVEQAQGLKKLKPLDLTKAMIQLFGDEVNKKLCKQGQKVKGIIIAESKDNKLELALTVVPDVSFRKMKLKVEIEEL